MKSKFSILLAVLALIASTLACAVGETTLDNVRTAKDVDGAQASTVFGTHDTIYVVGDLSNGVTGNVTGFKWYVDKVEGYESNSLIDETELKIEEDGTYTINSHLEPGADGLPVGSYKIEVYFNGTLNSTLNFTVE